MSSIIERPWSEEAFRDIRSGTNYEQNSQSDSFVNSEAEEAFRDSGSETKYGTSSEQSNQTDSSSSSEGCKSEKTYPTAAVRAQHEHMMFSVPKGASISPFYMIICKVCGKEMDNTLICPRCKRERPGRLIDNVCRFCDDVPAGHKSDSCPRKDNPVCYELPSLSHDEPDDIALMSDYEPSSP